MFVFKLIYRDWVFSLTLNNSCTYQSSNITKVFIYIVSTISRGNNGYCTNIPFFNVCNKVLLECVFKIRGDNNKVFVILVNHLYNLCNTLKVVNLITINKISRIFKITSLHIGINYRRGEIPLQKLHTIRVCNRSLSCSIMCVHCTYNTTLTNMCKSVTDKMTNFFVIIRRNSCNMQDIVFFWNNPFLSI